ncbi:hypothetical protein, partial [Ruegeria sp. SCP11]|uniref:hypothetical protein n=1 Tax=Ruegeria sp. SCP11 TaxID=3141378 RepID=UPI00333DDF0A
MQVERSGKLSPDRHSDYVELSLKIRRERHLAGRQPLSFKFNAVRSFLNHPAVALETQLAKAKDW